MDVDRYSAGAEAFATEFARGYYRQFAGLGGAGSFGALYDSHARLFSVEAVARLREAAAGETDPGRRRRLVALLRFAADGHLGRATAPLEAELARLEGRARVDGLRLGEVASAQAHEADGARRAQLEAERCRVIETSLAPLAGQVLAARHAGARALGWPSYAALYAELGGIELDGPRGLAAQAQRFLSLTDARFETVVSGAVHDTLGLPLDALTRGDLPRLFRQPALDPHFPASGLDDGLAQTLAGLGIDLGAQENVVLDLAPRTGKSRRAFCAPVRVPQEVYLVLSAAGGWDDYGALLHEAGHAQHFAAADPRLPFELRRLSDPAVGEAFAFLLERIADEPIWLRARGVGDDSGEIVRARRLLLLRRYAAKLGYELELHSGALALGHAATVYASRLSGALRVPWPRATWLTDVDPGLYVAHYLRAWTLAEQLRAVLVRRFGGAWFQSPAAGVTLRGWWRASHGLRAEEVLDLAGAGGFASAGLDFAGLAAGFGEG